MLCRPTTDKVNPMSIQYRLNVTRPMVSEPKLSGKVRHRPATSMTIPGLKRKNSAPCTNIARRLIHAAWKGENHPDRLWCDKRPSRSFKKVTGTSVVSNPIRTDFSTISDAYSHD